MSALMKYLLFVILLLLIPAILCQPPNTLETITADIYGTSSVPNSFAYTGSTLRTAQNNTAFIDRRQSKAVLIVDGRTEHACLLHITNLNSSSDYDITTNGEWIATAVTLGVNEISIFKCENGTATNIQQFQDADDLVIRAVQFLDGGILVTIASPPNAVDYSMARLYSYNGSKWVGGNTRVMLGPIVFRKVVLPGVDTFSKRNYQFQDGFATFITNQQNVSRIALYNTNTWTYGHITAPDSLKTTPFLDVAFNGKDSMISSRADWIYVMDVNRSGMWQEVYRANASALGFDYSFTFISGFGFSLAFVNQDTFLVTAPTDKRYSNNTGLVLVFKRINGIWSWVTNIQSSIKQSYFAQEIAVTNDRIIFDGDVAFQSIPRCAFEPLSYQCLEHANSTNCDLDPSTICTTEQLACLSFDRFVVKNRTRLNDTTIEVNFEIHGKIAQSVSKSVKVTCPQEAPIAVPVIEAPTSTVPPSTTPQEATPIESNVPVIAAPSSTVSPSVTPLEATPIESNVPVIAAPSSTVSPSVTPQEAPIAVPVIAAPSSTVSPSIAPQGNDKGITSNACSIVRGAWLLVSLISFLII